MSAKIFNGKAVAEDLLASVRERVRTANANLAAGAVKALKGPLKLVSFYKPDDPASKLYTRIKSEKAKSVGIEFEDSEIFGVEEAIERIKKVGKEGKVKGVVVQHPTGEFAFTPDHWKMLISAIPREKDVDGLREDSPFLPATVRAILVVLEEALRLPFGRLRVAQGKQQELFNCKVAVVGASGMVGRPLVREIRARGGKVREIDIGTEDIWFQTKNADVVISCVGKHNLIHGDQIKTGAVVIDVGSPGGDVDFESARAVASFLTPVPGGIGPLTVACLLENTVLAAEKLL